MSVGDEYRAKAAEFLAKAQTESDPKRLMEFGQLAAAYERLAGQAERNMRADLTYEVPDSAPPGDDAPDQA